MRQPFQVGLARSTYSRLHPDYALGVRRRPVTSARRGAFSRDTRVCGVDSHDLTSGRPARDQLDLGAIHAARLGQQLDKRLGGAPSAERVLTHAVVACVLCTGSNLYNDG
ncbi:MAG: hypothetical protein WKH64_12300 [Chloroflexia bacterium]